jgi:integrase
VRTGVPIVASLIKRGSTFYLQYSLNGKVRRISTGTDSYQLAKEKQRQYESARVRGEDNPLPTRAPLEEILVAYASHVRAVKRPKSAQTDVYYLRHMFGPICPELQITSRKVTVACLKRKPQSGVDRRRRELLIEAPSLEQVTTAEIAAFLAARVQTRGLAPKTANRYREILVRLFNWAATQRGVRLPGGKNPAQAVERYRERASEIWFLTLAQIDEQVAALEKSLRVHAMVATLIYAGLLREELTWLQRDDVDFSVVPHGVIRVRAKTVGDERWESKTKVNRVVPISRALRAILDAYAPRKSRHDWYFPSPAGARWDVDNFSADLRAERGREAAVDVPRLPPHVRQPTGDEGRVALQDRDAPRQLAGDLPAALRGAGSPLAIGPAVRRLHVHGRSFVMTVRLDA